MTEVRFYHLTRQTAAQALPDLLEKTLARGWRAVVKLPDNAVVEEMAAHLWNYRPDSFLPHGTAKDGNETDQPVWLTSSSENPNGATVLFLISAGGDSKNEAPLDSFTLVCDVFDGNDTALTDAARERWAAYKKQGNALTYWQQSETGWQKKGSE